MRVLLLGATGSLGRRTAAELLRQPEVEELWVSGRNEPQVSALAQAYGGTSGRVRALALDLSQRPRLDLQGQAPDVVVSCAGPVYETEVAGARAAIEVGASYVSLCDEYEPAEQVMALHEEGRTAGVTVISGCGLSPGITNLLIAHAVGAEEQVDSIEISLAASSAETDGSATALHLMYCLTQGAPVVRDGERQVERAGSSPRLVFFPEPVGWIETFHIGHPEILTMPGVYPGVPNLQFRLGLSERVTMDAARAFALMPFSDSEFARKLFITLTRPARPVIDRLPPKGVAWSAARVDVRWAGRTTSLGVADKMANLTSVPLTLAALRLGRKEALETGVVPVERAFDVNSFLRDLVRRGVGIAQLEPAPV